MNETAPDYGDPADWDDEWPDDLAAQVADELRELGWNVPGHHDSGVEIALPPYHETGVWLGGGGRLWTGLLESDSTCRNPVEVTANPADPGEIAANADPLLKEIAEQAARMAGAIAVGEIKAFLDVLAANPQPCDDAHPEGIASVPGPDGAIYLTEDALRTLYAKHERAAKGWRLARERAETLESENAGLHQRLSDSQAECGALQGELVKAFGERDTMQRRAYSVYVRADSIRALANQLRKLTRFMLDGEPQSPGWGTAELLARQVLMALGTAMPYDASPGAPQRLMAASAMDFLVEAPVEPQRPAEGFGPPRCPTPNPLFVGETCVRVVGHSGDHRDGRGGGWPNQGIAPEDEGIATADVLAQQAADARAYCPGCGLPETNCACG